MEFINSFPNWYIIGLFICLCIMILTGSFGKNPVFAIIKAIFWPLMAVVILAVAAFGVACWCLAHLVLLADTKK